MNIPLDKKHFEKQFLNKDIWWTGWDKQEETKPIQFANWDDENDDTATCFQDNNGDFWNADRSTGKWVLYKERFILTNQQQYEVHFIVNNAYRSVTIYHAYYDTNHECNFDKARLEYKELLDKGYTKVEDC